MCLITFMGSSKANLVLEKLDKNLGLADPPPSVGTKSQFFPKIRFEGSETDTDTFFWIPKIFETNTNTFSDNKFFRNEVWKDTKNLNQTRRE